MAKGVPIKEIKAAMMKHCGILTKVAEECGITRQSIYQRIREDDSLRDTVYQAREQLIDKSESALVKAIENEEAWAVSLSLKTLGKHRGYVEKSELDVGGNITVNIVKFGDGHRADDSK